MMALLSTLSYPPACLPAWCFVLCRGSSFLFLGPTGVGKTELAKALANLLFDDEKMMVSPRTGHTYDHVIACVIPPC
jgi:DNA polymerase III delta prime subunit